MDFLKRSLAPITDKAWQEIDEEARQFLSTNLAERAVVDVDGPHGLTYQAVCNGRLNLPEPPSHDELCWGIYSVQPLVEVRVPFALDIWELDNAVRGAKDVDLDPLVAAVRKISEFEERAVFLGFEPGSIGGLAKAATGAPVEFETTTGAFLSAVGKALSILHERGIGGPHALAINPDLWDELLRHSTDYPLSRHVAELIGGKVVFTPVIDSALLISQRGGDFELTLGKDFAIGYLSHDSETVRLFITESFTFRVHEPLAAIRLTHRSSEDHAH